MSLCTTFALAIGLYTTHVPAGNYNEENQLVGFQCDRVTYSTFVNSYHHRSHMVGYDFHYGDTWRVGVLPSLVTGYRGHEIGISTDSKVLLVPILYAQGGPLRASLAANAINVSLVLEF